MTWIFINTPNGESVVNLSHVVRVTIETVPINFANGCQYEIHYILSTGEALTARADEFQKERMVDLFKLENESAKHKKK